MQRKIVSRGPSRDLITLGGNWLLSAIQQTQ
jgi:hypothetical protein